MCSEWPSTEESRVVTSVFHQERPSRAHDHAAVKSPGPQGLFPVLQGNAAISLHSVSLLPRWDACAAYSEQVLPLVQRDPPPCEACALAAPHRVRRGRSIIYRIREMSFAIGCPY